MRTWILAFFLSSFLLACAPSSNSGQRAPEQPGAQSIPEPILKKLGDIQSVKYNSPNCTATISGSDSPPQLLVSAYCYGYSRYEFVFQCPHGLNACKQIFPGGGWSDAGLSQGYHQIAIITYSLSGSREFGQTFTRVPSK